ncbi:hypothetical protein GC174_10300 [bacterium]|nr:hypothetical protein [bacterium]
MIPLECEGELTLESEDCTWIFSANGKSGVLSCLPLQGKRSVLRAMKQAMEIRKKIKSTGEILKTLDFSMNIEFSGKTVARLGQSTRPGVISRLTGWGTVEIHPWVIIKVMFG